MALSERAAEMPSDGGDAPFYDVLRPTADSGVDLVAEQFASFADASAWVHLSEAGTTESFSAAWLELQCRLIGGVRSAVVVLGPNAAGNFVPLAYWPEGSKGNPAIAMVAELAMAERRGVVRQRQRAPGEAAEDTDALSYPLVMGEDLRGAVAIEVVHDNDARLRLAMRMLQWGCAWWHRRLAGDAAPRAQLTAVLELLATALQEERFLGAATAVATELATGLHCERVALGVREGRHAQVCALSHTANFNKKSGLVRALGTAMDEAIDQQETLVLPRSDEGIPLVTQAHEALMEQHGSKAVCTIPLSDNGQVTGALTLERGSDQPFGADEVRLCEHAGTLIGPVLEAKRRDDRWIGAKIWDSVRGLAGDLLGAGHLALKATVLALVALALFFFFATGDNRITAPAVLEGTVQRAVTAPQDGYIAGAEVRAGDLVGEGQLLAALEDKSLRLEKVQWEGEREKHLREYSKALAERDRAQVRILGAQVEQAEARIALLTEQLARARLTAPFAGVVVSGDLSQSLGAPVSRGDVLFEIAPLDSYRVILKVDERDISQARVGQTGGLALAGLPGEPLSVRVEKITPVATTEEGRNLFRVEAALESASGALRPGMKGVAKIDVDERNLFWIWTHKLAYWVRLWWWSWWP
jgi:RND family efflux transporter MFP subunit